MKTLPHAVLILQYWTIFVKVKIVNVGIWTLYFEIHSEYVLTPCIRLLGENFGKEKCY